MKRLRTEINVSYRICDELGNTLEVKKKRGFNRRYLKWWIDRYVQSKYGKGRKKHTCSIDEIKVEEIR